MEDTEKYLIHAAITADGVVERSDVVGAIFGQTEGLLGDDLDLRDLQQSSKVGRIDVEIDSQNGQSFGTVTIASSLDRVKTAILAASLETITRVGPCRATAEVTDIEDVREAKRREVVERAKELLSESFDESVMSSNEILSEVKESVRIEDISEHEGLPAGPNVADSDAVVVVEGRADVLTLLSYGIKNAIAVEGTNVPEVVADLTQNRTTTAFLDGDRGGELILRELTQVGDVDHVAFAPSGRSVEDLKRHEVFAALRNKVSMESYTFDAETAASADDADNPDTGAGGDTPDPPKGSPTTESAAHPAVDRRSMPRTLDSDASISSEYTTPPAEPVRAEVSATESNGDEPTPEVTERADVDSPTGDSTGPSEPAESTDTAETTDSTDAAETTESTVTESEVPGADETMTTAEQPTVRDDVLGADGTSTADDADATADDTGATSDDADESDNADGSDDSTMDHPQSLADHVREVIDDGSGTIRLLDADLVALEERPVSEAFDALSTTEPVPYAAVVDGEFSQRLLDVAAQRGVDHAVAASTGEFVKKPVGVRLLTADQLATSVAN
ncbi:MAG: DNA primase DnaG [Halobellus sp.]|uniref:DNA primase DnaG n=1 Tax=Halobellus sp. TaxID=1979212 RepID=UPI0035D4C2E0